jgi:hypothetical protein
MQKSLKVFTTSSVLLGTLFFISQLLLPKAFADIEWSGVYRFEGNAIHNSEVDGKGRDLGYGLNHLVLRPKIVAGDGLTIQGQFHILNSAGYPNSQLGQVWGSGVNTAGPQTADNSGPNSNAVSDNQRAETIEVSQLYLTLNQEFGQLLVGRAPLHFGLGMTHNAGRGLFDHWYDTRDMVGYKFIVGNLYFLPMIGKVNEGRLNRTDDMTDFMIQMQYENPESDIEMGVFYQMRKAGDQASDAPTPAAASGGVLGGVGALNDAEMDMRLVNVYALKDTDRFRLGLEASFQSGETGVRTASGEKVTYDGFGVAAEFEYRPEASNWKYGLKAGTASGDDPTTDGKFEGFIFDRNYDVAFLMFNHPLGQADFLRTGLVTGTVRDATTNAVNSPDTEAISNVVYVSPTIKYAFSDRWSLDNTITTGFLGTNPIAGRSVAKDLGYEWDISVNFSPRKGVMWVNTAGLLFPGSTWKGDGLYDSSFAYGFTTKAAISF